MICISIFQESRRFALVDMLNAAPQCDLLEVRLDRFGKSPEVGELVAAKPKPIIFSCRRPQDGGGWDGSEDERLALLRQCIISKADYVEIEEDVADQVRPFPGCKRVISYTNLNETPADIGEIYGRMQSKKPDVIKIVVKAGTPEEVWPLVQLLSKPTVPTVVVGLGREGIMLTILARRMGSPWTYAALERGMEAYAEQPTVTALRDVYRYQDIGKTTRFTGVTGMGEREFLITALLNASFALLQLPNRILPMDVGNTRIFRKVIEGVKIHTVVVDQEHRVSLVPIATMLQGAAARLQLVDVLAMQGDDWQGFYLSDRAASAALEVVLRARTKSEEPLKGRAVMLVGVDETARALGHRLIKSGAMVIVAGRNKDSAQRLAQELQCRFVAFEGVYSTLHDVLVYCSDEALTGGVKGPVFNPRYLKAGMTVMDLTAATKRSGLLREAEQRGCSIVPPKQVILEQALQYAKLLSNNEPQRPVLQELLNRLAQDDD